MVSVDIKGRTGIMEQVSEPLTQLVLHRSMGVTQVNGCYTGSGVAAQH